MSTSPDQLIQVGDRVRILYPAYVAGRTGVVCAKEDLLEYGESDRWLIQIDDSDMIVSILPEEMILLNF